MPERIQLKRKKGWRLPANTVVVSRPSRWGNPFRVGEYSAEKAVALYRASLAGETLKRAQAQLRGKSLACWCKPGRPCHADVLIELANKESDQ